MGSNPQYADLLRALDGMRNFRAILTVIAGFVLAFAVAAAGIATNSGFGIFIFGLMAWLIAGFAANAAGIVLMHQALDQNPPSIVEALFGGVTSFLKLLAIFLILALAAVLYTVVVAVLIFVCKLPGFGPLLFALLLPVLILISGIAYIGLILGAGLMAPAVWKGAGIQQALLEFFAILRDRLVETIVRFFLLVLLMTLVFGVVMLILGVGTGFTVSLSAAILSGEISGGLGNVFGGMGRIGGGSGYAYAAVFGLGILQALVLGLGFCVATMGNIRIYLVVSAELETDVLRRKLQAGLAQARQKAADMEERLTAPTISAPSAPSCPACRAPIAVDDIFCGSCGHRLR